MADAAFLPQHGSTQFAARRNAEFDEKGRRVDAPLVIIQWQNGEPVTVYPPQDATAKAIWAIK